MGKPKTYRQRMIDEQDDRNRRMKKVRPAQRDRIRTQARSVFHCRACDRHVFLSWERLVGEGGTPKCRDCGGPLQLVTACLTRGVLPKVR